MYKLIEQFEVVTGSAQYDLVSLEVLKTALEITGTDEDAELQRQITAISQAIAEWFGYPLAKADVLQTFVFEYCERPPLDRAIVLTHTPIEAVHELTVDDALVAATDYDLDLVTGRLWRRDFGWWGGRVEASYTGGYMLPDEAPATLQMAVIDAIGEERAFASFGDVDPSVVRSVSHLGVSVNFQARQAGGGLAASTIASIKHLRRLPI